MPGLASRATEGFATGLGVSGQADRGEHAQSVFDRVGVSEPPRFGSVAAHIEFALDHPSGVPGGAIANVPSVSISFDELAGDVRPDGFKMYNDRFGHMAGDTLLSRLAHKLGRRRLDLWQRVSARR